MVEARYSGRCGAAAVLGLAGALAAALGCVGPQVSAPAPSVSCSGCAEDALLIPGRPLEVHTSWAGTCEGSLVDELLSKSSSGARMSSCDGQRYRFEVSCETPCLLDGEAGARSGAAQGSSAEVRVMPVELGPFAFSVVMTALEDGTRHEYQSPVMTVRAPDAIGLLCLYNTSSALTAFQPCDERPLRAEQPLFQAVGELAGVWWLLPQPVLNERRNVPSRTLRLVRDHGGVRSLRDLFPEAAAGAGVRPGEYSVTLQIGEDRLVQVLRVE